jgi:hypothetical protein
MTSSREDNPEEKVVALLQQIREGLAEERPDETSEERADRLENVLKNVSSILTVYGASVFTLALHQVQLVKQVAMIEELVSSKMASKAPPLPHLRKMGSWDDTSN